MSKSNRGWGPEHFRARHSKDVVMISTGAEPKMHDSRLRQLNAKSIFIVIQRIVVDGRNDNSWFGIPRGNAAPHSHTVHVPLVVR